MTDCKRAMAKVMVFIANGYSVAEVEELTGFSYRKVTYIILQHYSFKEISENTKLLVKRSRFRIPKQKDYEKYHSNYWLNSRYPALAANLKSLCLVTQ